MFDAMAATEAAPGGQNDDFLLIAPTWAFVLDGVSVLQGDKVGCTHGVRWYVSRLASGLASGLALSDGQTLADILFDAIAATATMHGEGCDVKNPMTPAATVAIARAEAGRLDWLVLGDAAVSWQYATGEAEARTDDRLDHLKGVPIIEGPVRRYDQSYIARLRNAPGGFWVAAAQPEAAREALTGSVSLDTLCRVGLFSDGVTRLVERYGSSWAGLFDTAHRLGPRALIEAVREAEANDPDPSRWRGKPHDDATLAILTVR
jgi:Protein phosphatase 2C